MAKKLTKPNFNEQKEFFIGAYNAPHSTDSLYKIAGESGITHMMVNTFIGREFESEGYYKTPYRLAKKYGFKVVLHCMNGGYQNVDQYEEVFKRNKDFIGVIAIDEPDCTRFDYFKEDYQIYKKVFPGYPYYINLLPMYSTVPQLGGVEYEEYLRLYREKILRNFEDGNRVLMCDTYPLLLDTKIYPLWLKNIELLREIATEDKADLHFYLQDQSFWDRRQPTTLAEINFQSYVYLAYGTKALSHYPYLTPTGAGKDSYGVTDEQGQKSLIFDYIVEANKLLQKLNTPYHEFEWRAVIANIGSENATGKNENIDSCRDMKTEYGMLKSVESTKDTIVGCFDHKDGYEMYVVVNFTEPLEKGENKIQLSIKDCDKAIVYVNGDPQEMDIVNGKLSITLLEGEGVFVIPFNK